VETIWAPWRMSFILGAKPVGCFLCDAPTVGIGEESLVLQLTEHSMVIMNRYPYVAGHLMVAPRRHVDRLDALSPMEPSPPVSPGSGMLPTPTESTWE